MDAYDIFKKLTKGLTFKTKVLGIENDEQPQKTLPVKKEEKLEQTEEIVEEEDDELSIKIESESLQSESEDEKSEDDLQLVEGFKVGEKKKQKKNKEKSQDLQKKLELEEQNRFRNEHGIKTVGRHVPAALLDFSQLAQRYNVSQALVNTVKECGYDEPTPVQRQALPCMLEDRQIFACAPTGSGKTAAFLLPILHMLGAPQGGPRALILCPTRELAHQIYREVLRLSVSTQLQCNVIRNLKESKVKEREATFRRSDIVISTPNRLCYLLNQDTVNITLDKVRWLIVDEADKLFEGSAEQTSDFRQQMEQILAASGSKQRRVAMFSATHTPALGKWTRHHLRGLINITVGHRNAATHMVDQELMFCGNEAGKLLALRQLVQAGLKPPVLVFVQSKERAKQLFKELLYDGIHVDVIHADRTQAQRDNVVRSFRVGRIWVLICTEVLGRGVDFRGVNLVLNYDFPPSAISYIHRVGRAGRAGVRGRALTLFTQDDLANLRSIASVMKQSGCEVPEYMLQMRQSHNSRRNVAKRAPRRDHITTILGKKPDKRKLEESNDPETAAKDTPNVTDGKNKKQRKIQNVDKKQKKIQNGDQKQKKIQNGDQKQRKFQNGDSKPHTQGKWKKGNAEHAANNMGRKGKTQKKNNKNSLGHKNAKKSKT